MSDIEKIIEEFSTEKEKHNTPAWVYYKQHAKPHKNTFDFVRLFNGILSVVGFLLIIPIYVIVMKILPDWNIIISFIIATIVYVLLLLPLYLIVIKLGEVATENHAKKVENYNEMVDLENNHLKELLGITANHNSN